MLKLKLSIHSGEEAHAAIRQVRDALSNSNISSASKAYLEGAICPALALWAEQLSNPMTKTLTANRTFEGDDYRIAVRVGKQSLSAAGIVKRILGWA